MRALFVIAPKDFRDEEFLEPSGILADAGAQIIVASAKTGTCKGMLGAKVKATIDLVQALDEDVDATVFVGGKGSKVYFDDKDAHALARKAVEQGRTLGAICIAPTILGEADLLGGYKVTSFPSEQTILAQLGAKWTGNPVEVAHVEGTGADIVTGNGPQSATPFGEALLSSLRSRGL